MKLKMKIVFNDKGDVKMGSTRIHIHNIHHWFTELGHDTHLNDWDNYGKYDVVVFGKNVCTNDILEAKRQNEKILCGQVNPSDYTAERRRHLKSNDFFIVGSIPEQEYYCKYAENIFLFPQIERIYTKLKKHDPDQPVVLGYHGNKDHLLHFEPYLKSAIETLAKERQIKLIVCYDKRSLGEWTTGRPDIEIEEIQWDLDTIEDTLLKCDIGLVPGLTTIYPREKKLFIKLSGWFFKKRGGYDTDYFLRFKNCTNSGRAFVFHQLGIPVISDFIPSSFHILSNPKCGYLANSKEGWLFALRELCASAEKRQEIATNAKDEFNRLYDPLEWSTRLYSDIERLWKSRYLPGN